MADIFVDENGNRFDSLEDSIMDFIAGGIVDLANEIDSNLQIKTPVDTGKARANWQWKTGTGDDYPTNVLNQTSRPLNQSPRFKVRKRDIIKGDDIFSANNVPYIGALDDGSSQQAPMKFTLLSVDEAIKKIYG